MRRHDPLLYALLLVLVFGAVKLFRPDTGYGRAVGEWLYAPPQLECVIPPHGEIMVDYFGMLYKARRSSLVDQRVLCYGAWEKEVLGFLDGAAAAMDRQDLVFVDVGAHAGLHSLFMSRRAAQVHAFEPYPPVLERLRGNVERNAIANLRIHPVGLGERAETLSFFEPPSANDGTGSFAFKDEMQNRDQGLALEIVNGDDYFRERGIAKVDVIKIDVEGFEKPVLLGLRHVLSESRPLVVMELTAAEGNTILFQSEAELRDAFPPNYDFFSYRTWNVATGEYTLGPLAADFSAKGQQWDVVASPAELTPLLPMSSPGPKP